MDILERAMNQRIGGADGEMVEELCAEILRLRYVEKCAILWLDAIRECRKKNLLIEIDRLRNTIGK